jgi:SAM-dependent methyltransferase
MKRYDRAYFDRWYRKRETRVSSSSDVRRKVTLAVSMAEYFLHRRLRTVLDIGCGEGAWLRHLRALRPQVQYQGIDASDYAVKRFGRSRNIIKGAFGDLPDLDLGVYDLVICSDVMHYVPDDEIDRGIGALVAATDAIAFLEVLTKEDDIEGDLDAFIHRPAAWYRRTFHRAGLIPAGPYCWLSPAFRDAVAGLEATSP